MIGSSGYLSSNLGAQIDHELLRNVIVTGQLGWGRDVFRGVDRQDRRLTYGASATYLMNRRLSWTLGYSHFDQNSNGVARGFDYDVDRLVLTLGARL